MNERQRKLLHILLSEKSQVFHIQALSIQLICSEKTVRNDLQVIEQFLAEYLGANLVRKPGVGVYLEIEEFERKEIAQLLLTRESMTTEERIIEIAYQLLITNKPITLQHLAERYYVSKSIIKEDLETIERWFERFDVELMSKQRVGNFIDGTERNKRNALARLSELIPSTAENKNYVLQLFMPYEITTVRKALQDLQTNFPIFLTDAATESLLIHALIMIKRTRQRSSVFIPQEEKERIYGETEYEYAVLFFNQLQHVFRIRFPEDERIYFTWHLISSKRKDRSAESIVANSEARNIVNSLTKKVGKLTLIDFAADTILTEGLSVHMYSVLNRVKYGFPITNPLLHNIKKMYPYMFNMVMLALAEIKEKYGMDIEEDEAAYIVLHFQAAIERLEGKRNVKKTAVIVCHLGVGMSYLLEAKIQQHYQTIDILDCIGKTDVKAFLSEHNVDFIISTVPLEEQATPSIVISPLLEAKDKQKLNEFVKKLERGPIGVLDGFKLSDVLPSKLIFLNVEKEHPYEVVEMLGHALYKTGNVNESFTHSAVHRERKSATSIGGGIAIPHGSPGMIHKSAIGVAVLKNPLEWGQEMVTLVFMLAIGNDAKGLSRNVIGEISRISDDPVRLQQLIEASNAAMFLEGLSKQEWV